LDPITSLSLVGRPYDRIRESILSGERPSGERIAAQGIATELGVSRTPVKEALARLDAEGLVVRAGNWGYSVRSVSLRDAEDIFESRLVIEIANARLAAERASAAEGTELLAVLKACRAPLKAARLTEFQRRSRAVHEYISKTTHNLQLMRMFNQISDLVVLFGISLLRANPARAAEIYAENEGIAKAICAGKSADAGALMRSHIEQGHASFREAISPTRSSVALW